GPALSAGKLFAVGDMKQSIYRFRGADVEQFQRLRHHMPHEGRLGLTVNFRSQPAVLDFVNALFAEHLRDYEPLQAHHPQRNPGPCVEFLWSACEEKHNVAERRIREADGIARRIAAMAGNRELLVADHDKKGSGVFSSEEKTPDPFLVRPVRQGDIVLL